MGIEGISAIGGVESATSVMPVSLPTGIGLPGAAESIQEERPPAGQAVRSRKVQTDQLVIGSKVAIAGGDGMVEAYARIRFDEASHAVLIQIVNAANDEVIREIPPAAWEKLKENIQFPTGVIVDRGPKQRLIGGIVRW